MPLSRLTVRFVVIEVVLIAYFEILGLGTASSQSRAWCARFPSFGGPLHRPLIQTADQKGDLTLLKAQNIHNDSVSRHPIDDSNNAAFAYYPLGDFTGCSGVPFDAEIRTSLGWIPVWTLRPGDLISVHMSERALLSDRPEVHSDDDLQRYQRWLKEGGESCRFQPVLNVSRASFLWGCSIYGEAENEQCRVAKSQCRSRQRWMLRDETWAPAPVCSAQLYVEDHTSSSTPDGEETAASTISLYLLEVAVAHNFHIRLNGLSDVLVAHNPIYDDRGRGIADYHNAAFARGNPDGGWAGITNPGSWRAGGGYHEWIPAAVAGATLDKWGIAVSERNMECFLNHWTSKTDSFHFQNRFSGQVSSHPGPGIPGDRPNAHPRFSSTDPQEQAGAILWNTLAGGGNGAAHIELQDLAGKASSPEEFKALFIDWANGNPTKLTNQYQGNYQARFKLTHSSVVPSFENCFS